MSLLLKLHTWWNDQGKRNYNHALHTLYTCTGSGMQSLRDELVTALGQLTWLHTETNFLGLKLFCLKYLSLYQVNKIIYNVMDG